MYWWDPCAGKLSWASSEDSSDCLCCEHCCKCAFTTTTSSQVTSAAIFRKLSAGEVVAREECAYADDIHGYSYRGTTATQCFKKNGKKSHFLFYWSARNELFIWLVVLVIWREKFLIFRARALIFLFSNTVCREQRFSSGQFHLCKNFPRSFCQEKKKRRRGGVLGNFIFFLNCPKMGLILFSRHW